MTVPYLHELDCKTTWGVGGSSRALWDESRSDEDFRLIGARYSYLRLWLRGLSFFPLLSSGTLFQMGVLTRVRSFSFGFIATLYAAFAAAWRGMEVDAALTLMFDKAPTSMARFAW